jgi:hypothetical protein
VLAGGGAKGGAHVGGAQGARRNARAHRLHRGHQHGRTRRRRLCVRHPASELRKFLLGIDWKNGRRRCRLSATCEPIEQKRAGVTYSNNFEMGLKDSRVIVAERSSSTPQCDRGLAAAYVAGARAQTDFDALPIPFARSPPT